MTWYRIFEKKHTQSILVLFIIFVSISFIGCNEDKSTSIKDKYIWSVEKISKEEEKLILDIKDKVSEKYADDPDSAKYYIREFIQLSKKSKSHYVEFNALAYMSQYYWLREDNADSAIYYFGEALKLMAKNKIVEIENEFIYVDMGNMFYGSGMYHNAIHSYRLALNSALQKQNNYSIILAYNNIGLSHVALNNTDSALHFFRKTLDISKEMMPFYEINSYMYMTAAYEESGNTDEEEKTLMLAQEAYKRQKAWKKPLVQIDENYYQFMMNKFDLKFIYTRAEILSSRGQTRAAIDAFQKAYDKATELKNKNFQIYSGISMAEEYMKLDNEEQAKVKAIDALGLATDIKDFKFMADAARILTGIYAKEKDINSLMKYVEIANAAEDSVFEDEEMHKNQQSRLLMLSNQINRDVFLYEYEYQDSLKDINRQRLVIVSMAMLILAIIVLLIINFKDKKALNEEYRILMEKMVQQIKKEDKNTESKIKKTNTTLPGVEKKLEQLMQNDKIFLNSNISLSELSTLLGTNTSYLSQYLNEYLNTNFNDFINAERVNEACRIMTHEGESNKSLDQIAEEVGFNSRSTFYSAFKKFTGITPAYFLKNIEQMNWKNQTPTD